MQSDVVRAIAGVVRDDDAGLDLGDGVVPAPGEEMDEADRGMGLDEQAQLTDTFGASPRRAVRGDRVLECIGLEEKRCLP